MKEIIQTLRTKSLVDFFSTHTPFKLIKQGKNYSCPCPLHGEKEASFYINPEKNRWACYGSCLANGDLIDFVSRYKSFSFNQALEYLCGIYGLPFKKIQTSSTSVEIKKINKFVADYYSKFLNSEYSFDGLTYLVNRKTSSDIIKEFNIGYCPSVSETGWDTLYRILCSEKYSIELAEKIGIIKKTKSNNFIDAFHERIIFPINNLQGDVIGFNTRSILKNKLIPRYLLSNETEIFNRKQIYYGYDKTKKYIEKKNVCILVEGIFDFFRLYEHGFRNCIPLLGGSYNDIKNVNTYYLMMDFDKAGIKYSSTIGSKLIKENKIIRICKNNKDPDDLNRKELITAITNAEDFIDWFIGKIFKYKDSIECKLNCLNEVSKLLDKLPKENLVLYGDRISKLLALPLGVVIAHLLGTSPNYKDVFAEFIKATKEIVD